MRCEGTRVEIARATPCEVTPVISTGADHGGAMAWVAQRSGEIHHATRSPCWHDDERGLLRSSTWRVGAHLPRHAGGTVPGELAEDVCAPMDTNEECLASHGGSLHALRALGAFRLVEMTMGARRVSRGTRRMRCPGGHKVRSRAQGIKGGIAK